MKFGKALKVLKNGGAVKRRFWSTEFCIYIKNRGIRIDAQAYYDSRWVPTHDDLLSNDWITTEAP